MSTLAAYKNRNTQNVLQDFTFPNGGINEFWPFLGETTGTPFTTSPANVFSTATISDPPTTTAGVRGLTLAADSPGGMEYASAYLAPLDTIGPLLNPPEALTSAEFCINSPLPSTTDNFRIKFGFCKDWTLAGLDSSFGTTDCAGAFFTYDFDAVDAWRCNFRNNANTINQITTTSIAIDPNVDTYFKIVWTTTNVYFYINNVLVANLLYDYVDTDFAGTNLGVAFKKTNGTQLRTLICRGIKFIYKYNTPLTFS